MLAQNECARIEHKIASKRPSVETTLKAAYLLLFDSWLYVMDSHNSFDESPVSHLAQLTRKSDIAELRIANTIRDMFYGRTSSMADLKEMLESRDPAYRDIFEAANWNATRTTNRRHAKSTRPLSRKK